MGDLAQENVNRLAQWQSLPVTIINTHNYITVYSIQRKAILAFLFMSHQFHWIVAGFNIPHIYIQRDLTTDHFVSSSYEDGDGPGVVAVLDH